MRAWVTGAAGFVGAAVVRRLLADGHAVSAGVRSTTDRWRLAGLDLPVVVADLRDADAVLGAVAALRPDVVVHAAAGGGHTGDRARDAVFSANVLATHHLLRALDRHPARLVHLGSSTVFAPSSGPIGPAHPPGPVHAFGAAKLAGTVLAQQWGREGHDVRVVRPFSVYGPRERATRLVPTLLRAARDGRPVDLTPPGYVRDLIHVDDVADAVVRAATQEGHGGAVFHVGTGVETANEALADVVSEVTGRPLAVRRGAWPAHVTDRRSWCADATTTREALGWSPRHDLRSGLADAWTWWQAQP